MAESSQSLSDDEFNLLHGLENRPIATDAFHRFRDEFERLITLDRSMGYLSNVWRPLGGDDKEMSDCIFEIQRQLFSSEIWNEMLLCRHTDNFLGFLSELLGLIFRHEPNTMKSNETVEVDVVLSYANKEEMIDGLAERKVERLGYKGMDELAKSVLTKPIGGN